MTGVTVENEIKNIKDVMIITKEKNNKYPTINDIRGQHYAVVILVYYEEKISKQLMYLAASRAIEKFLVLTPNSNLYII
jgi:hypothetical protein